MSVVNSCIKSTRLVLLVSCTVVWLFGAEASARQFGMVGSSQVGCGGFGCHGGQSANTVVTLTGPRDVAAGSLSNYTFSVAHPANNYSGFNATLVNAAGAAAGTLAAGANAQLNGNELTHTAPTVDGAGGSADFAFTWLAPVDHGVYTFYGAGNAVNNNGNPDGADVYNLTGGIQITVKGVTITAPNGGSYCRGTALTINWTQTGYLNFKIEVSSSNFTNSEVITNSVSATANTFTWNIPAGQEISNAYLIRFINTADGQEVKRSSAFSIKGAPTVTTHPQSQVVCEGRTLQLTVAADQAGVIYQWRKNGTTIPGATASSYQVGVAKQEDAGTYEAVVFGCGGSTTSNAAVVTIGLRPKITVQPVGKTVCENDSVSLFANGEGDGAIYQWYRNGEIMPGKTGKTLRFASILLTDEASYSMHISGTCLPNAVSNEAILNVLERPAVTVQPTDKNLKVGDTLSLTVDGYGESITYQWQKNGTAIPGATQKLYRKTGIVRADSGQYEAVITNPCGTATTRKALVRIVPSDGPGLPELASASLELGTIPVCAQIDTTFAGLLKNAGGTALNVTSISADPPTLLQALGFATPQTIAVGGASDLHLIVTPSTIGSISGTVTFFTPNGNAIFQVNGTAESGITTNKDTLMFYDGVTGFSSCVSVSLDSRCSTATITAWTLSGVGAGSYSIATQFPQTINAGTPIEICLETMAGSGGDAMIEIQTSAGPKTLQLRRGVFSAVEETDVAGVSIQPNPASEGISIKGLQEGAIVRILSLQGVEVINLTLVDNAVNGELVWNGRNSSGAPVASGTYVVVIRMNQNVSAQTLVLTR
ncbi:MAG: choice-of-anchor V domain-containing protein [bacterium]|nr:choice-of-anchor V domain-containing protein [bacterium]